MNGILLDTSAYSELARGNNDILKEIQSAETIGVNPIILGELIAGFAKGSRVQQKISSMDHFLSSPRCMVVPIIQETSFRYGKILNALQKAGTPIPTNDVWIAASAMEHGLIVVTTDAHFHQ
jgi:tRNA(fMet)-specific endonuclease VapC